VQLVPRGREVNQFLVKSYLGATELEFFGVRAEGQGGWAEEAKKLWKSADHRLVKLFIDSSLNPSTWLGPDSTQTDKHKWWIKAIDQLKSSAALVFGDFRMTKFVCFMFALAFVKVLMSCVGWQSRRFVPWKDGSSRVLR